MISRKTRHNNCRWTIISFGDAWPLIVHIVYASHIRDTFEKVERQPFKLGQEIKKKKVEWVLSHLHCFGNGLGGISRLVRCCDVQIVNSLKANVCLRNHISMACTSGKLCPQQRLITPPQRELVWLISEAMADKKNKHEKRYLRNQCPDGLIVFSDKHPSNT